MADYKIMPHNIEAEQALLGCILIDVQDFIPYVVKAGEVFRIHAEPVTQFSLLVSCQLFGLLHSPFPPSCTFSE